jgi:DNA-binding YbaB/EbfC family protein
MQPGMPDLTQIVLKAQQMQADMERAQAGLADAEVTGTAGGGLVSAVVSGAGELRAVQIDPSVLEPATAIDAETLGDLVVAAVRNAQQEVADLASRAMGAVTGGLADALGGFGLPVPGGAGFGLPGNTVDEDPDDGGRSLPAPDQDR